MNALSANTAANQLLADEVVARQMTIALMKNLSFIQYSYGKCVTRARMSTPTLGHGTCKNGIRSPKYTGRRELEKNKDEKFNSN